MIETIAIVAGLLAVLAYLALWLRDSMRSPIDQNPR